MAIYFVGDIQGCYNELIALLEQVNFSSKDDQLWVAGDLVARGPDSLKTLRFIKSLKGSAKVVLGNHDLHLLAIHAGLKKAKPSDKLTELLNAPDIDELMVWLAQQPLVQKLPCEEVYMSHAGLPPHWTPQQALKQSSHINNLLRSNDRKYWLSVMYGEKPEQWHNAITTEDKFRFTINSLTRMRYCRADNSLEFSFKLSTEEAPANIIPWYKLSKGLAHCSWIFGHWAALMGHCPNANAYALDTGCVWGNHLTLLRWHDKKRFIEVAHKKNRIM
jgi:bis(5'-nucleosyl)-tetraphosphatase (symmetrical)